MKKFMKENKAFSVFGIIALLMLIIGIVAGRGNELTYMLFGQYILLPVVGFIACMSMGKKGGKLGFITPVIVFAANVVIALAVFGKIDLIFLITGAVPTVVGCAIGLIAGKIKKK